MNFSKNATVVLVHGAWADGSSWQAIIRALQERGLDVLAAPIPLTSLSDDAPHSGERSQELKARSSSQDTPTREPSLPRRTTSA
jgi:hypothetical protein